jgi:Kef-type K+ transport system membrane component KefB
MNLLIALGIILLLGFLFGALFERWNFPKITGYLVAGALLSPSVFHVISCGTVESLNSITPVVLGVIAYHIGLGLRLDALRSREVDRLHSVLPECHAGPADPAPRLCLRRFVSP